jgi:cold shock CspA family protein
MDGQIKFYDESVGWGVIMGVDGRLYSVRGRRLPGPPLRVGERVIFEPEVVPGGPRAASLRRVSAPVSPGSTTAKRSQQ